MADSLDGLAVIGMSGRFPGARDLAKFWHNLCMGLEGVTFFSDEELAASGVDPAMISHPQYVKARCILDECEMFDASFFGYTPREARFMDPQHRVFLECGWSALENAGYNPEACEGLVGVFAGESMNSYLLAALHNEPDAVRALGTDKDFLTTRLSYKLNLKGPSVAVQTACSTSLVAVCVACQSLLTHQCDVALAGGVSIGAPLKAGYLYMPGGIFSPDGHCRPFDADAAGTTAGFGVGIVVLKRLEEALNDGDTIHAAIKGTAVNNDGANKIGYTAPSVEGQAAAIATAQAIADFYPDTITYIEAHGTGTKLGDPIEVAALTRAFQAGTKRKNFCALGAVKSNIGHLDAAAGIAGLIKTVLSLRNKQLPPTLNYCRPNPGIDFDRTPFFVNTELREWTSGPTPRRAGISSFGIGGTNAHVVLEEAPTQPATASSRAWNWLPISARSSSALDSATADLARFVEEHPSLNIDDAAYTLLRGRKAFEHRCVVVCRDASDAAKALRERNPSRVFVGTCNPKTAPRVAFLFPGQGSQFPQMGSGLYRTEPAFRNPMDEGLSILREHLDIDLHDVLFAGDADRNRATDALRQTYIAQPAIFLIEYALAKLLISWGIRPSAMIGHSVGEYVAACLSGVLAFEDALNLVVFRGRLMHQASKGAMTSVPLSESEVRNHLQKGLSVAAVNAARHCVVSGAETCLMAWEERLRTEGIACQRLHTGGAFHSELMDGVVAPLVAEFKKVTLGRPQIPYMSNLSGTWITEDQASNPEYWGRHLRSTVRFSECVAAAVAGGINVLLEVGPGRALTTLAEFDLSEGQSGASALHSMKHPQQTISDEEHLAQTLGRLWLAGITLDSKVYFSGQKRRRIELPTYPFERERYWFDVQPNSGPRSAAGSVESPRKADMADWFCLPSWRRSLPAATTPGGESGLGPCLTLLDSHGFGESIAVRLESQGVDVVRVREGREFRKLGSAEYEIGLDSRHGFDSLLRDLRDAGIVPKTVIHFWGVAADGCDGLASADRSDSFRRQCFDSLVYLAQAWGSEHAKDPLRIVAVTNGVHSVTGQEELSPEKALIFGPLKVIPQEYPKIRARHVDVVLERNGIDERAVEWIMREVCSHSDEQSVAYRGMDRWVPALEPVHLEVPKGAPTGLRERGVYWITGGLGGIGLAVAEDLARTVKARLILTGRSGLPPRDQWAQYVHQHGNGDATSLRILAVQALEKAGAEVLIAEADASNEQQMACVLRDAKQRWGRVDGVVHSAGVPGGGLIQQKSLDTSLSILKPKVEGTRVLCRVLDAEPLDFVLLCSSLTAITGGAGQVDYTAANAFQDAFARDRTQRLGRRTISVNWDRWRDVGMSLTVRAQARHAGIGGDGLPGLTTTEGVDLFRRILAQQNLTHVAVFAWGQTVVPARASNSEIRAQENRSREAIARPKDGPRKPRPGHSSAFVAPFDDVERRLCEIWEQALEIHPVGVADNFFELGGHSHLAVGVMAKVNHDFGSQLPAATLYDALTIRGLAGRLKEGSKEIVESAATVAPEKRLERSDRQRTHQEERRAARNATRELNR